MTPTHEPSKRPLSDAEFDVLDYVVISDARKIQADARHHRARVRELERERDHLRGMVDECEAALLECKHEDEEIAKLQRRVEAARTALEKLKDLPHDADAHLPYGCQFRIASEAIAALAGTEGEAPE